MQIKQYIVYKGRLPEKNEWETCEILYMGSACEILYIGFDEDIANKIYHQYNSDSRVHLSTEILTFNLVTIKAK